MYYKTIGMILHDHFLRPGQSPSSVAQGFSPSASPPPWMSPERNIYASSPFSGPLERVDTVKGDEKWFRASMETGLENGRFGSKHVAGRDVGGGKEQYSSAPRYPTTGVNEFASRRVRQEIPMDGFVPDLQVNGKWGIGCVVSDAGDMPVRAQLLK